MYPMVVSVDQFRSLKRTFDELVADLNPGPIRHGVMLEVPSACLQADVLLREADFASVGTNDLMQYLLAVDRDNERVAHDFSYDTPVLWDLLRNLARTAAVAGKELSVCGEMAGDPKHMPMLIEAGIRSVSVSARRISSVRASVASMSTPPGAGI
jgi:phosphotransferase system enzyme I (PtsI)